MISEKEIQDLIAAYDDLYKKIVERIHRLHEIEKAFKKEKEQSNLIEDLAVENQECY